MVVREPSHDGLSSAHRILLQNLIDLCHLSDAHVTKPIKQPDFLCDALSYMRELCTVMHMHQHSQGLAAVRLAKGGKSTLFYLLSESRMIIKIR